MGKVQIELKIDNSYSQISGLKTEEMRELRKVLSYSVSSYHSGLFYRKYLIDKKGIFPTGLVRLTKEFLAIQKIQYVTRNLNKTPKATCRFVGQHDNNPYLDQKEAVIQAACYGRGGIVMPTGTGKSRVIAMLIEKFQVRTLIVVPTLEIKLQLIEFLHETFGRTPHIRIENIDSPQLKHATGFDMLIIDECHHAAARTYQKLNKTAWKNIYYRFFLTATYFRNQSNEHLLFEGIVGQEIFRLTDANAVKRGYIVPVVAFYEDLPYTENNCFAYREVYNQLVVNNDYRNSVISEMLRNAIQTNSATLCIVKEIEHGLILSELSGVPFVCGEDEKSKQYIEQFKCGEIPVLIGTAGVLGEGVDTKPAEYIIIAGLGKAKSSIMQWIGRGRRRWKDKESCKIILFRDTSHKFLLRHFRQQAKVLKEEFGVKPIKL